MKNETQLFKALADETRLKILWLLMNQGELCVTDIIGVLDITQSKTSRHLQTLFHAGLVAGRRERFCVYYRISAVPESREGKLLAVLREMLAGQPFAADEKIFPLRKGILHNLEKLFNYLPRLLPAHA